MAAPQSIRDSFESKIERIPECGCWIWTASLRTGGYAQFFDGEKLHRGHRWSWETFRGPIPDGMCVLHRCDVRCCVNPAHLFLGTRRENSLDMQQKGRSTFGTRHPMAKLTDENVLAILSLTKEGKRDKDIAKSFLVSRATINAIRLGKIWTHLRR